jgi:adenine phosphoribosyltransferase
MGPAELAAFIRDIPDFPKPGVVFKDITPLLGNAGAFAAAVNGLAAPFEDRGVTAVVGIEARGFIFAAPIALRLGTGFVPVRKPAKLPSAVAHQVYDLEYGSDRLEMHLDGVGSRDRVLVVDDVLATGGTAAATVELIRGLGATVAGVAVLIELDFLGGRSKLPGIELVSLVSYGPA